MNGKERSILLVTCYGHFVSHFNMLIFPAILLPLSAHFSMSMAETLALSFWMYVFFGVSALPWGILGDKFGPQRLLMIFHLGAGLSCVSTFFTFSNHYMFSLSLAGIGLFSGIYHPVGLGWIAKSIKRTSVGMAYNGMFGNLGLASAPIFAGVVNYFLGPEGVYSLVAIINITGLLFIAYAWKTNSNTEEIKQRKGSEHKISPFLILLVAMMLGGIVYRGTSVTLPAYFEINGRNLFELVQSFLALFGSGNVFATLITSIIYLFAMVGQYLGGRVGEKYDLRFGYFLFHAITIPASLAMAFTFDLPLVLFAIIHSFFLLGMQPIENTLVARLAPPKLLSSAYGLKFILTFGVGALSVKMIEYVEESYGLPAIFITLAFVSTLLVAVIFILFLNTRRVDSKFKT